MSSRKVSATAVNLNNSASLYIRITKSPKGRHPLKTYSFNNRRTVSEVSQCNRTYQKGTNRLQLYRHFVDRSKSLNVGGIHGLLPCMLAVRIFVMHRETTKLRPRTQNAHCNPLAVASKLKVFNAFGKRRNVSSVSWSVAMFKHARTWRCASLFNSRTHVRAARCVFWEIVVPCIHL